MPNECPVCGCVLKWYRCGDCGGTGYEETAPTLPGMEKRCDHCKGCGGFVVCWCGIKPGRRTDA